MTTTQLKELANELAYWQIECRRIAMEYKKAAAERADKEVELKHAMTEADQDTFTLDDGRSVIWVHSSGEIIIDKLQEKSTDVLRNQSS